MKTLGIDAARDTIRVVGIGDMSGDVFGNGMLLSRSLKLVAAFDHRHIFVDPNPDPACSCNERPIVRTARIRSARASITIEEDSHE
ncbi:NAD-specific glutamate dehydrogenase [Hoyosella subflava DQS3-9A1]|uniref:NAD-specific glutamate dehydrogenase n=1 Tax=Hoyosella subflava (strain DSM 45089 / JCM 17490 / NBRC 109087 / DQS3-9A1) TaxID=443218 RepID=F6EI84_HOYSD|nr:NAD-specific glutamate dehydrogenase [Hoyosella subflava DQS3-9A1]